MHFDGSTQGPELGLLFRSLRSLMLVVWRAVTLPYGETIGNAIFTLTFLWVLVFQTGTPKFTGERAADLSLKRVA